MEKYLFLRVKALASTCIALSSRLYPHLDIKSSNIVIHCLVTITTGEMDRGMLLVDSVASHAGI